MLPQHVEHCTYGTSGVAARLRVNERLVSDLELELAKCKFEESRTRLPAVTGKVSSLVAVAGIVVSASFAALSALGLPNTPGFLVIFCTTVAVFVTTAWFLFKFLGVGRTSSPSLDQRFLDLPVKHQKAEYLRDLMTAAEHNDRRTDFLVDVYKAGRRLTVIAVVCSLATLSLALINRVSQEDRLIQKLRSDPKFIELLRGPAGSNGTAGLQGPRGERGVDAIMFWPISPNVAVPPIDAREFQIDLLTLNFATDEAPHSSRSATRK